MIIDYHCLVAAIKPRYGYIFWLGDSICAYLNCDALEHECDSREKFYQYMNDQFIKFLNKNRDVRAQYDIFREPLFIDYITLKEFTGKFDDLKIFIIIDEFEILAKKEFADNTFFSNLRAVASSPDSKLAFVTIISLHSLKESVH